MTEKDTITLIAYDNTKFVIPIKSIRLSQFLCDALSDSESCTEIYIDRNNINGITSKLINYICEYLVYYEHSEPKCAIEQSKIRDNNRFENSWDTEFINKIPLVELFQLIEAVQYFQIETLLTICASQIANLIQTSKQLDSIKNELYKFYKK